MDGKNNCDISIKIGQVELANPTILASGLLGLDCGSLKKVVDGGAGAVTIKSLTTDCRKGHNNPIIVEFECGLMNAVGYANKGIDAGIVEFKKWDNQVPMIGSIVGADPHEFAELAVKIQEIPISALEIVLSCPHTPGFGLLAGQGTPEATLKITEAVRRVTKLPLWVKLSPSVPGVGEVARAAESGGADAINMGNTAGPGMKIDIERAEPILHFKYGGMSGPAIKPLTIRSVWDIYQAVKIPIIATGGITTGLDAIEAIMAGATAVGIGSAIYYRGIDVFSKITKEISDWMINHNYKSLTEIRGKVHEN
jgi:dihydroorotate dehydrogenase (NAD+) catalytic subunit